MIFVRNLLLTGMIILSVVLPAQQTQIYNRAEHMFRQGVELFTTRHYAAARACFEQVAEQEDGNRLADREASIAGVKSNALTGLTICQQLDYCMVSSWLITAGECCIKTKNIPRPSLLLKK